MTTVVISISPGDIQVISDSQPEDGYCAYVSKIDVPVPELSIVEHNEADELAPPLLDINIEELHNKYRM